MNDRNHEATPKHALTLMRVLRADGLVVNGLRYQSADLHLVRWIEEVYAARVGDERA